MKKLKLVPILALVILGFVAPLLTKARTVHAGEGKVGENGVQSTATLRWKDRAHIYFDNVNIVDGDSGKLGFDQSTEASKIREVKGEGYLNTMINKLQAASNTYTDDQIYDAENLYQFEHACGDTMTIDVPNIDGTNEAILYLDRLQEKPDPNPADSDWPENCAWVFKGGTARDRNGTVRLKVEMKDTENKHIWFRFTSDDEIESVDGKEKAKRYKPPENATEDEKKNYNDNVFFITKGSGVDDQRKCGNQGPRIILDEASRKDTNNTKVKGKYETCDDNKPMFDMITVRDNGNVGSGAAKTASDSPDAGKTDGGAEKPDITCETELLNPLTWIVCPLVDAAKLAVAQFDNAITQRLTISTKGDKSVLDIGNANGQGFYKAWSTFRYLALIMLVIIGLVMVLAQASSSDFIDAYTIKKVMPRLFIAVVLITLSWSLCLFAIDLSNALGVGVRSIIYAPFGGVRSAAVNTGAAGLLTLGAGGALASLGILGIGSFALTALLAVLIGFGVIVFREMLIVLLVTLAPVALVCWILPNTQRAWKMWWDFFTKALLAFPIITMMIATGQVFSKIAASVDTGLLGTTISFICYFGPYFMIPTAFKLAGGAIATISGAVGDKSRGGFDRLKNYRAGQRQKNAQGLKEGTRWQGRSYIPGSQRLASRVGKISHGASLGVGNQFGLGARGREASDASLAVMADEKLKSKEWQGHMYKDDVMRALTYGDGKQAEAALRERYAKDGLSGKELEDKVNTTMIAANQIGFGRTSQVAAATQMAMNKSAFDDAADAMETVQRVGGGNSSLEGSVREKVKFINKQVGRNDGGALEGMNQAELDQAASGDREGARQAWNDRLTLKGAETADGATLARNHAKGLENIAKATQRTLDRDGGHGPKTAEEQERFDRAGKVAGALDDSKAWATLGNVKNIDDTSHAAASELAGSRTVETPTGRQFIEDEVVDGKKTGRQVITPETESRQVDESVLTKNKARVVADPTDPRNQANQQNQNPPGVPGGP